MSVGVSRQYAVVVGKVDNCQVGVYCSLVNGENVTLIHQRLFLPESWTSSPSLSLSNSDLDAYTNKEYAWFQAQCL